MAEEGTFQLHLSNQRAVTPLRYPDEISYNFLLFILCDPRMGYIYKYV